MNYICKIKIKGASGTGFFCKIPFENNDEKNYLMTNYHIIDENYINENNEINLIINDSKIVKELNLKEKREKYFNKDYDIAIIEILKTDNIQYFLELDDNLFQEKIKTIFEDESIYIIQYPGGKNASVSYGLIKNINDYDIKHIYVVLMLVHQVPQY